MKVYRKSTLAAAVNGYLEYEIVKVFQQDRYRYKEIQFKGEEETNPAQLRGDGTVVVYFPDSNTRWQHIYASKGQDGGTRKNKRATRKNKRPTLRPGAELRAYEHINRHGKQVMARYNVCYKKGCQKISAKTYKSFQKK
jgi:hypothetical protein